LKKVMSSTAVLCLLFGILSFAACGDDDDDDDGASYEDYLLLGKQYLVANEGAAAADAFGNALALNDAGHEARYGLLLANSLMLTNFIDQIMETISAITFEGDENDSGKSTEPEHINAIHLYLLEYNLPAVDENEELYDALSAVENPGIQLDHYELSIEGEPLLTFGGEFDKADLHLFGAYNALIGGVLHLLMAHDLYFDPFCLDLGDLLSGDLETEELVEVLIGVFECLMNSESHPTFLNLDANWGLEYMQQAGVDLGNTMARLASAFTAMALETDDQADDQLGYTDVGGNGRYDAEVDPVFIGKELTMEPELAVAIAHLAAAMAPVFYEGSTADADPAAVTKVSPADFNELLTALKLLPIVIDSKTISEIPGQEELTKILQLLGILPLELGPYTIESLPAWPNLNVGRIFAEPSEDLLRIGVELLVKYWYLIDGLLFPES